MLNGQPMGGKRRSAYHYDLWCLKYLSKFQWESLTEEIGKEPAQIFELTLRCAVVLIEGLISSVISRAATTMVVVYQLCCTIVVLE